MTSSASESLIGWNSSAAAPWTTCTFPPGSLSMRRMSSFALCEAVITAAAFLVTAGRIERTSQRLLLGCKLGKRKRDMSYRVTTNGQLRDRGATELVKWQTRGLRRETI